MTLPSTVACGNIVRPTLNFNWYAVPDSSWGNYHSVHNKSHNNHLENDFIICHASIKVSSDPLEMHMVERNGDEMRGIENMWWKELLMVGWVRMHMCLAMFDWQVCSCCAVALDADAPRHLFPETVIKIGSVFQANEWHRNQSIKNGLPLIMEFPLSKDM